VTNGKQLAAAERKWYVLHYVHAGFVGPQPTHRVCVKARDLLHVEFETCCVASLVHVLCCCRVNFTFLRLFSVRGYRCKDVRYEVVTASLTSKTAIGIQDPAALWTTCMGR